MGLRPWPWGQLSGPSLLMRFERAEGICTLPAMPPHCRWLSVPVLLVLYSRMAHQASWLGLTLLWFQGKVQGWLSWVLKPVKGRASLPTFMIPGPVLLTAAGGEGVWVWGSHHPSIPTTCYSSTSLPSTNTFFLCCVLDSTGVYGDPFAALLEAGEEVNLTKTGFLLVAAAFFFFSSSVFGVFLLPQPPEC